MALTNDLRILAGAGMDTDSSLSDVAKPDNIASYNLRTTGTGGQDANEGTNIESTILIPLTRPVGLNRGVGGERFETIISAITFNYNSAGYHQITMVNADTKIQTVLFTNIIDSGGENILPLKPKFFVNDIKLVNDTILIFTDGQMEPCYINLTRLISGGYGVLSQADILLIKDQPLKPIQSVYGDDASRSVNLMSDRLFIYTGQWVYLDFEYSAWSMRSKRVAPGKQTTPSAGTDVTVNNHQIISVDAGTNRVKQVNIASAYNELIDFFLIKSVLRTDIIALPNTAVDVSNEIYEAYDPTTNIYSFVFYNDGLYPNIAPNETDLPYDYVPRTAGTIEVVDNNILVLGDILEGYPRPTLDYSIKAVSYDPNLTTPDSSYEKLGTPFIYPGDSGSGLGDHRRAVIIMFKGTPKIGDVITITFFDIRDSNSTRTTTHTVTGGEDGNVAQLVNDIAQEVGYPASTFTSQPNQVIQVGSGATYIPVPYFSGAYGMTFITDPYYTLGSVGVSLFNAGSDTFKSIHAFKTNSSYQFAFRYRNKHGQFFPLVTDNRAIVKTLSYAQSHGLTPSIQISILSDPPEGAVDYQVMATKNNTHATTVPAIGVLINYLGTWNASNNSGPTLSAYQVSSNVGDTRQVIAPGSQNIGNGTVDFAAGDYVIYNGVSWDRVDKSVGNLTTTVDYLFIKIDPLRVFNDRNSSSVLFYDWASGDRCTFNYYIDGGVKKWFDAPAIDVEIVSQVQYLIKVRKPASLTVASIVAKDLSLELYSPKKRTETIDNVVGLVDTLFYEIGERYDIIDGKHSVPSFTLYEGDIYFKTLQLVSAVNENDLLDLLVEDFNFSVYIKSNYNSYGRPGTYYDTVEGLRKKASIRYSDVDNIGSKINGLTRFFGERLYGDGAGQSQSAYGAINKLHLRNNRLVCIQELKEGYIPVNATIIETLDGIKQLAVSDKLLNSIEYGEGADIGMANCKTSFAHRFSNLYYVDTNHSLPIRSGLDGVKSIAGKKSRHFKLLFEQAIAAGNTIIGFYDDDNEEYVISISDKGDVFASIGFTQSDWVTLENYSILPANVTSFTQPSHGVVTYNSTTGLSTYTPTFGYVGSDNFTFTYPVAGVPTTKRVCIDVLAGDSSVNPFSFTPKTNQPLSTQIESNTILVNGNNIAVPISITGGEYSVNGGAYTNAAGYVNAGDIVSVRVMSSPSNSTSTSCTLTISATSGVFTVTTLAGGTTNVEAGGVGFADTGERTFTVTMGISAILPNDCIIGFNIRYQDSGSTFFGGHGSITILAGDTYTVGHFGNYMVGQTPTDVDILITSVSPNPNGTNTIIY